MGKPDAALERLRGLGDGDDWLGAAAIIAYVAELEGAQADALAFLQSAERYIFMNMRGTPWHDGLVTFIAKLKAAALTGGEKGGG